MAGLYAKYNVFKIEDGTVVNDCFVLRPDRDPAAVIALRVYAKATNNRPLKEDIINWVGPGEGSALTLNEWAKAIHQNAVDHGWWEDNRSFGDIIALCHSELSEALEEYRNKKPNIYCEAYNKHSCGDCVTCKSLCGAYEVKPEGMAIEMADCLIRILDWFGKEGIDIEQIVAIKHVYNKTRPYKHGGKRI